MPPKRHRRSPSPLPSLNYLRHADNYIPAKPAVTPSHMVPEWYFLPFYAILRAIPGKLVGVIAMFGSIVVLVFVPWLGTSQVRSTAYRPLHKQFFWVFVLVCVLLGWLGSKPAEGGYTIAAQVCTLYYFVHFLIVLPLLGFFEKPLPNSILESVMGARKSRAAMRRAAPSSDRKRLIVDAAAGGK